MMWWSDMPLGEGATSHGSAILIPGRFLVDFRRTRIESGRIWKDEPTGANLTCFRPAFGRNRFNLPRVGPESAKVGHIASTFGQNWPNWARNRRELTNPGPISTNFGPKPADAVPEAAKDCPSLAKLGPNRTNFWPSLARVR